MSNKNKILIIVAIILIIILSIGLIKNKNNVTNQGQEAEKTTNLVATKKTNGTFEIYNTDIKTDAGTTKITATIKNISVNKTVEQKIELLLLDYSGNEIETIIVTVPSLESGKSTIISAESLTVYENIKDFSIK